jgi:5-methylcytosine-specific restriction endonuclease McrA
MDDRYISTLHEIVTRGRNTNSYKFALWRALATLAPSRSEICKSDLSPLFLKYYWPLEVKYHLRQGIDPDKDPVVMKRIRQLVNAGTIKQGETLKDFKRRMPEEYKTLLDGVAREAFDDVIPRFHNVSGEPITPSIFTFTGKAGKAGDTIELTNGSRRFLIKYKKHIDYVAVSGRVRFTEEFTSAPKLHDKIDGANLKRGAVSQWRASLSEIQHARCFYDESHDMASPEVDHVLPWSFVLEDKTWNLVVACRRCNNEKRDRLANADALERLCARNQEIAKGHAPTDPAFFRHFSEWHSRDL